MELSCREVEALGCEFRLFSMLWAPAKAGPDEMRTSEGLRVRVPHTVVYAHGVPSAWYFTAADGVLKRRHRRHLRNEHIFKMFGKRPGRRSGSGTGGAAAAAGGGDSGGIVAQYTARRSNSYGQIVPHVEYFTRAALHEFLFERERDEEGLLQRFVVPEAAFNKTYRCTWTPHVCLLETCTNSAPLADRKLELPFRAQTFDGAGMRATTRALSITSPVGVCACMPVRAAVALRCLPFGWLFFFPPFLFLSRLSFPAFPFTFPPFPLTADGCCCQQRRIKEMSALVAKRLELNSSLQKNGTYGGHQSLEVRYAVFNFKLSTASKLFLLDCCVLHTRHRSARLPAGTVKRPSLTGGHPEHVCHFCSGEGSSSSSSSSSSRSGSPRGRNKSSSGSGRSSARSSARGSPRSSPRGSPRGSPRRSGGGGGTVGTGKSKLERELEAAYAEYSDDNYAPVRAESRASDVDTEGVQEVLRRAGKVTVDLVLAQMRRLGMPFVTQYQLHQFLLKHGQSVTSWQYEKILTALAVDDDGRVSLSDFAHWLADEAAQHEEIEQVVSQLDGLPQLPARRPFTSAGASARHTFVARPPARARSSMTIRHGSSRSSRLTMALVESVRSSERVPLTTPRAAAAAAKAEETRPERATVLPLPSPSMRRALAQFRKRATRRKKKSMTPSVESNAFLVDSETKTRVSERSEQ
eukprot:PLAT6777.3.p1 GENE.PLAT6777.3~~PLAT6777.3.p1  ORF type:complete len:703 (-),score=198.88 PLAT6777.3:153-2231(-)